MLYKAIRPNFAYKGQEEVNFPKGEPMGKNELVFLCTPSFSESLALLSNETTRLKECYYTRYMTDVKFRTRVGKKAVNENQISNFRDTFAASAANNSFTYIPINQKDNTAKKKYNLIFDLGHWNEIYFKFRKNATPEMMVLSYLEFLNSKVMDPSFQSYHKILVIPVAQWAKHGIGEFGITREYLDDPVSIMMALCYRYPQYANLLYGMDLYMIDPDAGQFLLTNSEFLSNPKNYGKLKQNLFKFSAIKFASESEEISSQEDTPLRGRTSSEKQIPVKKSLPVKQNTNHEETVSNVTATILQKSSSNKPTSSANVIAVTKVEGDTILEKGKTKKDISQTPIEIPEMDTGNLIPPPVISNQNDPIPQKSEDTILKEETEDEINYFVENDDEDTFDDNFLDEEAEVAVKKNAYIAKFRPEFSVDQKKRIDILEKKQNEILKVSIPEMKSKLITPSDFHGIIHTKNRSILEPKAKNFTKSYNEKKMEQDIDNAVGFLSHTDYPIYVIGKEVEDTSDTLNAKKTYTYKLQDYQGEKFTIKFDMPIMLDDRYIYLNGIKSVVENQLLPLPILKTGPNEVQINGEYNNKIIMSRKETSKLDSKTQAFKKYFLDTKNSAKYKTQIGNCIPKNKEIDTPLDFDNISKNISELTIGKYHFIFDIPKLLDIINEDREKKGLKPYINGYDDKNSLIIGYNVMTKEPVTVNEKNGENTPDVVMSYLPETDKQELMKTSPGASRFTYVKAKMASCEVPIIFFMLYCNGLTDVLQRIGVKYDIVEPGTEYNYFDRGAIKMSDKWIIWDKYPFHNSLLLNGMDLLPTEDYSLEEMDSKETYANMVPIFFKDYRRSHILDQFKDFMLGPIDIEVLKDMNMPTNLIDLMVVAAIMLNNNKSDSILDMKNVRIRNNEIFATFVYRAMADGYIEYRKQILQNKKPKFEINKYLVTMNINGSAKTKMAGCKLIEGASSLNPILELEKQGSVSYRGPAGMNKQDAYTLPKRAYNPSMTGIIGISSSPDANVGIQRQLVLDPNIKSTRGYLEAASSDNIKGMISAELFTPAELLSPPGVMHDDGQRTAMSFKQSKYMVLTDDMSPVMIGNKVEAAVPYYLSREFVVTAQDNGKVIAKEKNIVIVQYDNGKRDSFSLDPIQQKNSAGGFYIETRFETDLNVGDTFKKGQVLAYNPNAFTKDKDDISASMNIGVLCKIAIVPTYDEYEDSAPITAKAAERLATSITMEQSFVIGSNARVDKILKPGDHVDVGDSLAIFDNWVDDPLTAKFLEDLGEDLDQSVSEHVATREASEYAGEIVDVKYYSAVDLEELSPTLQPYVKEYWNKINAKNKVLKKYQNDDDYKCLKCGQLITEKAGKTESKNGKIFGREVEDGVLVRFFIKHKDIVKKGDKLTNYTALKGIVSNVIGNGLEPYSEYRKDEPIDILMAPGAILARKTPSAILSMFGNKVLIELKRQVKDIYNN